MLDPAKCLSRTNFRKVSLILRRFLDSPPTTDGFEVRSQFEILVEPSYLHLAEVCFTLIPVLVLGANEKGHRKHLCPCQRRCIELRTDRSAFARFVVSVTFGTYMRMGNDNSPERVLQFRQVLYQSLGEECAAIPHKRTLRGLEQKR